jgi:hypothetical protein
MSEKTWASPLAKLCAELEAFETAPWAAKAILEVEIMTREVFDPCCGTGVLGAAASQKGYLVKTMDIRDWSQDFTCAPPDIVDDFLSIGSMPVLWGDGVSVYMNPPFSTACDFVDRARQLGARKIICFQRQAWRESVKARRDWWEKNPPARVWVCGARATCWRFDLKDCQHPEGTAACGNFKRKGKKHETQGCAHCMGSVPTSHAFYVWERGHRGAEITNAIYPPGELP